MIPDQRKPICVDGQIRRSNKADHRGGPVAPSEPCHQGRDPRGCAASSRPV